MAIYEPKPFLTQKDRELLYLLGQLVSEDRASDNAGYETIPLSPGEGERLLVLLEQFADSKVFIEGSYFSEGMANGNATKDENLREIYLSWRKRRGRNRMMASRHWNEFVVRLGFGFSDQAKIFTSGVGRGPVVPMPFSHFVRMEQKLMAATDIHPRVADLVVKLVSRAENEIEEFRRGQRKLEMGSTVKSVQKFLVQLGDTLNGLEKKPVSKFQIVAVTTIVADTSMYFTTRDWTATGVLSNLAAVTTNALDT